MASAENRENEWLKRVGNPARLELGLTGESAGTDMIVETIKTLRPGSDLTIMLCEISARGRPVSSV